MQIMMLTAVSSSDAALIIQEKIDDWIDQFKSDCGYMPRIFDIKLAASNEIFLVAILFDGEPPEFQKEKLYT